MAIMNALQIIKRIPKFEGENFVERTRSLNSILQVARPFLSNIISGLEIPSPILRESREGKLSTSDDDNDSSSSDDVIGYDSGNLNERPQDSDGIKA